MLLAVLLADHSVDSLGSLKAEMSADQSVGLLVAPTADLWAVMLEDTQVSVTADKKEHEKVPRWVYTKVVQLAAEKDSLWDALLAAVMASL